MTTTQNLHPTAIMMLITALDEYQARQWPADKDKWTAALKLRQDLTNASAITLVMVSPDTAAAHTGAMSK